MYIVKTDVCTINGAVLTTSCTFVREGEHHIIEELCLRGSFEAELNTATAHCLDTTHTNCEVGWVQVVVHLKAALVPQFNL